MPRHDRLTPPDEAQRWACERCYPDRVPPVSEEALPAAPCDPLERLARRPLALILVTGLASYLISAVGALLASRHYHWAASKAFRRWDSLHYLRIAQLGYPHLTLPTQGRVPRSDLAFFPGYPLTIRALHALAQPVGLTYASAGWAVNGGCGLAALVVIATLVRRWFTTAVSVRTAQTVALFPGAAVLVFDYTEGLFLLLASGCLLAVTRRRWATAGVLALLAGGVRANGLYLTVLLAAVSLHAVLRDRDWRSALAPLLAPWGFCAYMIYLWRLTGRPDAWFATERWGWHQRNDFLAQAWHLLTGPRPFSFSLVTLEVAGTAWVLLVLLLSLYGRLRLPPLLVGYVVVMIGPLLLSSQLGWRPRFLLSAFPLMVAPAYALRRWSFLAYCLLSALGLVVSAYYYAGPVPP